jgi:unsaturated rhamnogalacturonyl hydrolase
MEFYPDPSKLSIHSPGKWSYEYGLFLNAGFELWQRTKKQEYLDYMKKWADNFVDDKGQMTVQQYDVSEYKLDDILPGRLFISLYTVTKEEKYKIAAERFVDQLHHQPRTADGGYWHKQIYPHQMWLDGILMGDVFSAQFASVFKDPKGYDDAIQQIKIIAKHTTDPATGLMYHGWDESKNKIWAHPEKGTSPEFWSRAIGWYMMALVQCLD